ncbi:uncharacterized protein LOC127712785 [Mytilus californianus]|uniref:uncharacterized protein LOC127712785 n=1 Tax=Mytilus californianus TaxID=6549 RepID=UPI0022478F19|nr:uncharacterized protein LOC127712785 [Mytilus californianus]
MECKITLSLICIFFLIIPNVYPQGTTLKQIKQATGILEAISGKDLAKYLTIKDVDLKGGSYIKNIKITHVDIPKISIKGDWKKNIIVEASNIGLGVTADWRVKKRVLFIRYRESGTLRASVSNVSFKVTLNTRTFSVANCSESIGSFKVKLKGKLLAWVIRTFVNVDKLLKRKLKGQICKAISKEINKHSSKISRILQG